MTGYTPCCNTIIGGTTFKTEEGTLVCAHCGRVYAPATIAFRKAIRMDAIEEAAHTVEKGLGKTNTQIAKEIRSLR